MNANKAHTSSCNANLQKKVLHKYCPSCFGLRSNACYPKGFQCIQMHVIEEQVMHLVQRMPKN